MLAIAAAAVFGLALVFDLVDATLGDTVTSGTLVIVGLLLVALHLAGYGNGSRSGLGGRSWSWRRVRR
ncbi:hypothetical protein [Nocardia sp. CC201C]|uniref:hypothetical protein n=1 Tax=Nocardia sp. CC201C TaxID=3044575 RepID=UPI0024A99219|nr:hypothetical protein [Nocardia sp. CC201C]